MDFLLWNQENDYGVEFTILHQQQRHAKRKSDDTAASASIQKNGTASKKPQSCLNTGKHCFDVLERIHRDRSATQRLWHLASCANLGSFAAHAKKYSPIQTKTTDIEAPCWNVSSLAIQTKRHPIEKITAAKQLEVFPKPKCWWLPWHSGQSNPKHCSKTNPNNHPRHRLRKCKVLSGDIKSDQSNVRATRSFKHIISWPIQTSTLQRSSMTCCMCVIHHAISFFQTSEQQISGCIWKPMLKHQHKL